jgi:predicted DNA binding CopG/RHH family protein
MATHKKQRGHFCWCCGRILANERFSGEGTSMAKKHSKRMVPKFRSEEEEREFWARADSADYVDWSGARRVVFSKLKPTQRTISLRLPAMMLAELKLLANKRDVPYQSLMKMFLADRIEKELRDS